jgi:hypothetical protein
MRVDIEREGTKLLAIVLRRAVKSGTRTGHTSRRPSRCDSAAKADHKMKWFRPSRAPASEKSAAVQGTTPHLAPPGPSRWAPNPAAACRESDGRVRLRVRRGGRVSSHRE